MADVKTYNPKLISVTLGPVLFRGFMDGTFLEIEREKDSFSKHTGAGGDTTRVRNLDISGTAKLTLISASPTNDELSALLIEDELNGGQVHPFFCKELNGTTIAKAESAWIQKFSPVTYGEEVEGREWMITLAELQILVGGLVS